MLYHIWSSICLVQTIITTDFCVHCWTIWIIWLKLITFHSKFALLHQCLSLFVCCSQQYKFLSEKSGISEEISVSSMSDIGQSYFSGHTSQMISCKTTFDFIYGNYSVTIENKFWPEHQQMSSRHLPKFVSESKKITIPP